MESTSTFVQEWGERRCLSSLRLGQMAGAQRCTYSRFTPLSAPPSTPPSIPASAAGRTGRQTGGPCPVGRQQSQQPVARCCVVASAPPHQPRFLHEKRQHKGHISRRHKGHAVRHTSHKYINHSTLPLFFPSYALPLPQPLPLSAHPLPPLCLRPRSGQPPLRLG